MALVQVAQGAQIRSNDLNQIIVGLDGTSAVTFTVKGDVTHEAGARVIMRSTAAATLVDTLNTVGGITSQGLSLAYQSPSASASLNQPVINSIVHIRPNGSATDQTGSTYLLKSIRYGSTASGDGTLAAHYSLLVQTESQSSYNGFAGGHDQVGVAGHVIIHGNGDGRGGLVNSPGRGYPGYFEGVLFSPSGQVIGSEMKVVNNSGTDAAYFGASAYTRLNFALQLVGQAEEAPYSVTVGSTGPANVTAGSHFNTAAINIVTSDTSVTRPAFLAGIFFNQNSVKNYLIDAWSCTFGTQGPPPFVRMAPGMPITALQPDLTADSRLIMLQTVSGQHNIFFGRNSGADKNIQFVAQGAPTTPLLAINPLGILDLTNNPNAFVPRAGTGLTPAFTTVGSTVTGMPSAATPSWYMQIYMNGTTAKGCIPVWPTT